MHVINLSKMFLAIRNQIKTGKWKMSNLIQNYSRCCHGIFCIRASRQMQNKRFTKVVFLLGLMCYPVL